MKKQCFIGLGGAGKNSLEPFFKNEGNAEFVVIDTENYKHYNCKWIDAKKTEEILQYFETDKEFIFLLGLSCHTSANKQKTGVELMQKIGTYLNAKNQDYTMILSLPFSYEYGDSNKTKLDETRKILENLATETIIVDNEQYQEKYAEENLSIMSEFHYKSWREYIMLKNKESIVVSFDDLVWSENNSLNEIPQNNKIRKIEIYGTDYSFNEKISLNLSKFSNLEVLNIDIEDNQFEEINVEGLNNLRIFNANYSIPLRKVKHLETMPNLEELSVYDIIEVEKYPNLKKIKKLFVAHITEPNKLKVFSDLEDLECASWEVPKMEGFEHLTQLKRITIRGKIEKIENLENLTELQYLNLEWNKITKIEGLSNLKKLEVLSLAGNQIKKIEGLNNLENLKKLILSNGLFYSIGEFGCYEKTACIKNDYITKIEGINNLKKLEFLDLSGNLIEEIEGLENLESLKQLKVVVKSIDMIKNINVLKNLQYLDFFVENGNL